MTHFEDDIANFLEKTKKERLNVLVWGPGKPGTEASAETIKAHDKRKQIKQVVNTIFQHADVFFSEDSEMRGATSFTKDELLKEATQAKAADVILILDVSRGADLEIHHYPLKYPQFRDKFHVFLPDKYIPVQGLVKSVFGKLSDDQIEGFSEDEFEQCSLATEMAVNAVHAYAVRKALEL